MGKTCYQAEVRYMLVESCMRTSSGEPGERVTEIELSSYWAPKTCARE